MHTRDFSKPEIWLIEICTVYKPKKLLTFCGVKNHKQNSTWWEKASMALGDNSQICLKSLSPKNRGQGFAGLSSPDLLFPNQKLLVEKKKHQKTTTFCITFHLVLTKAEFYTLYRIYLFGWTFLLLWSESFFPACVYQMSSRCSQRNRWPVKQEGHTIGSFSSAVFACSERVTAESLCIVFSILIKRAGVVYE